MSEIKAIVKRGYSWDSFIVTLLSATRYGLNIKKLFTHVAYRIPNKCVYSAESSGFKKLPHDYYDNLDCKFREYDFPKLSKEKEDQMINYLEGLVNNQTKYSYARYIIDSSRILSLTSLLTLLYTFIPIGILMLIFKSFSFYKYYLLFFPCFSVLMFILWQSQLKRDKKTVDCAESQSKALEICGLIVPFTNDSRNEIPDNIDSKLQMLEFNGGYAKLCRIKERYGKPIEVK